MIVAAHHPLESAHRHRAVGAQDGLMIGTNDAIDNYDMADAPARRGALIDTARANTDPNVQGYVLLGTQWYVVPQPLL